MKYTFLLFFVFFIACTNTKDKEDKCKPCQNNSTCNKETLKCECDAGYHLDGNICVADISCEPNPCKEDHKTVCSISSNTIVCSCEFAWVDINGKCFPDLCVEPNPCRDENKNVCKLDNKGKIKCECNENYHLEGDKCVSDELSPCHPNPCKEEHKTRCLLDPEDNSKFTCNCDVDYHKDGELCCQAFSHNESGSCVCNEKYIMREGECKVICSEESIEALNGECVEENKICVQGQCIDNLCVDYVCPENSSCATQNNHAICYCDPGYHMDNNLCCKDHASNVNGQCKCDSGYHLNGDDCIQDENNPCESNPCTENHKNICVVDDSTSGYHCECNQGFTLVGNECKLVEVENCPNDLICLNSYCVEEGDRPNEQCLTNEDCHEFNPESTSYCNPSPVGGVCLGCNSSSDCPGNTQCEETYHTCKNLCDSHSDCPSGKCSFNLGYCLVARCQSDEDCSHGSVCLNEGNSGYGLCKRIPCKEKACSEFNPNGACENGKTCVYGVCTDSCSPNPCTKHEFKDVCSINNSKVVCSCRENYTENAEGNCVPSVQSCKAGFSCENNFCVDRTDTGFVCANDNDCGANSSCSNPITLPSGLCKSCTYASDCPNDNMRCLAGYCLQSCVDDSGCNKAMMCDLVRGVCKKKDCDSSNPCEQGYICNGQSKKCERIPCNN